GGDAPFVDRADANALGHPLDAVAGGLRPVGGGAGDRDDAAVFDVDLGTGLLLEASDHLAARADHHADLFGIDLDLDQPRGVGGDLVTGPLDRPEHGPQDLDAGLVGLVERVLDDLLADPLVLQVELDAGDARARAGDLEVHVAE